MLVFHAASGHRLPACSTQVSFLSWALGMVPVLFSGLNTVGYGRSVSHDTQHLSVRSLCPCVWIYTSVGLGKKREFRRLCNNSSEFEFLDDSVKRHMSDFDFFLAHIFTSTTLYIWRQRLHLLLGSRDISSGPPTQPSHKPTHLEHHIWHLHHGTQIPLSMQHSTGPGTSHKFVTHRWRTTHEQLRTSICH